VTTVSTGHSPWPGFCRDSNVGAGQFSAELTSQIAYNTEKMWDNSGRKKPHKTLKIRAGKMAVTVEILPR
jgi:hypothetical protein